MSGNIGKMNDPDATLFVQVAEITDSTQRGAIVDLVKDLKSNNLWSKMKAIYPFVGEIAASHKWNLKDPRDVDAAFRLSFNGGWTHSSTGADPNGTNAWADTFILPSSVLSQNSTHISYYSRETTANTGVLIGTETQSPSNFSNAIFIQPVVSGRTYTNINSAVLSNIYIDVADSNGAAYYIASRISSTTQTAYRNNLILQQKSANSDGLATSNISIGAYLRNSTRQFYTDRQCAFATIGDGLTDSDAANLYTIVQKYQTTLGRQV